MKTLKEEYAELIGLAKHLIAEELQEHNAKKMVVSDSETYQFFKAYAHQQRKTPQSPVIQAPAATNNQSQPVYKMPPPVTVSKQVQAIVEPEKVQATPSPLIQKNTEKTIEPTNTVQPSFELTPLEKILPHDLSDIKKIVRQIAPNQIILDQIPCLNPQILIVSDEEQVRISSFLANFSKALDITLAPSKIVMSNKINAFQNLKMVIQIGGSEKLQLESPYLFLYIPDSSLYLRDPKEKSKLWENVKHVFFS